MKVLLTGGSGFVGKNLLEQLSSHHAITAPTHNELDLLDEKAVERFFNANEFGVVIHTAGPGVVPGQANVSGIADDTLRMFKNIAGSLKTDQRMIFLGSGAEYDKRKDLIGIKEQSFGESEPADEYGLAKYECSKIIETRENITNLRCFGVYGKYENTKRFISAAILSALHDQPIVIRQNVVYDFLYIDDLVKIIDYFITNKPKEKFYNAVSGNKIDLVTLANIVKEIIPSHSAIVVEQQGLQKEYSANNSRLLKEIPDFQFTSPQKGIEKLSEYYKNLKA